MPNPVHITIMHIKKYLKVFYHYIIISLCTHEIVSLYLRNYFRCLILRQPWS